MTKQEALDLIDGYCVALKRLGYTDETMVGLRARWQDEGSEAKAMRWLGFMQGCLFTRGVCSLDEIKHHSRDRKVTLRVVEDESTVGEALLDGLRRRNLPQSVIDEVASALGLGVEGP